MTGQPYPHLGFNPSPGGVETVSALQKKLTKSAQVLDEAHRMIERLRAGVSWEGDAAVAFRKELDGALPTNLKNARTSILKAASALGTWQTELIGYQDQAKILDGEAKAAKEAADAAETRQKTAAANPDLKLAHQQFTDDAALRSSQTRLDNATRALTNARNAVNDARGDLTAILNRAHELEDDHGRTARGTARTLRDATDKLAPEEPNWFEKSLNWVDDNLTDILGAVAAIAGLLALLLTGPIGVALLLVAAAASAGALASRLSDPAVRASLVDGFTKGEFDSDFWSNAVGVAGDTLGVVPGAGALARGVNGAVRSASAGAEALTLGEKLASAGSKTWVAAERIADGGNPLTTWLVKGAADPSAAGQVVDVSVAGAGALTGSYGVAKNVFEGIKSPGVENTATGMDGIRAGSFDGAGHGATALKTLGVLFR